MSLCLISAPFTRATTGSLAVAGCDWAEEELREQPETTASTASAAAPSKAALMPAPGFLGESKFNEIMGHPRVRPGAAVRPDSRATASSLQCPNKGGF